MTTLAPEITPLGVIWSFRCRHARQEMMDPHRRGAISCAHPQPNQVVQRAGAGVCIIGHYGWGCPNCDETMPEEKVNG